MGGNPYFRRPLYYEVHRDRALQADVQALIDRWIKTKNETDSRLYEKAIRKKEEVAGAWLVENCREHYECYDLELFSCVGLLLERQIIDRIDISLMEQLLAELREDRAVCTLEEQNRWWDEFVTEIYSMSLDDMAYGRPPKERPFEIGKTYRLSEHFFLAERAGNPVARGANVYFIQDQHGLQLFEIEDGCGRLANESGFLFIQ